MKQAGDALMDQHRYAEALAAYERAYAANTDPVLLYNESRALEAMGEYPEALDRLEKFEATASPKLRARVLGLEDHIADLRGRIATVTVKTNVPSATLIVRGKSLGEIHGARDVRLRAGAVTIEVSAEGYEPFRRDVDVSAGAAVTVDANLVAKVKDAVLKITSKPASDVVLDGRPLGRTPLETHVAAGVHDLVARSEGYRDETVSMSVTLGETRDVDLELKKTPPVTARWWFWTGVVVVVAGGVAATYALTTERSPPSGSLRPGTVKGP